QVEAGHEEDTPEILKKSPGIRAIYNNLNKQHGISENPDKEHVYGDIELDLAQKIDTTVKSSKPDGWRGVQARELVIKRALFDVLKDVDAVERIFPIIKAQREY